MTGTPRWRLAGVVLVMVGVWTSTRAADESGRLSQGVEATIVVSAEEAARAGMRLTRHTAGLPPEPVAFAVRAGSGRDAVVLTFDCVPGSYVVTAREFVSAPITVEAGNCKLALPVVLFPAGVFHGTVRRSVGESPSLSSIRLSARWCGVPGPAGDIGEYQVPVGTDGGLNVTLPAGCVDVTVGAKGFAPVRLPRVALGFRQIRDVGPLLLKPGATLSARVIGSRGEPIRDAIVAVVRSEDLGRFVEAVVQGRSERPQYEGRTDAGGEVSFIGIEPRLVYVVARRQSLIGFGGPCELEAGGEFVGNPISLSGRASARVSVVAESTSWRPPGAPVSVEAVPNICGRWLPSVVVRDSVEDGATGVVVLPFAGLWRFELHLMESAGTTVLDEQEATVAEEGESAVLFSVQRAAFGGRVLVDGQ